MECWEQNPVLVTGATGFIGGRLVRRLRERNCRVSCVIRASSQSDGLRSLGAQLIRGNVTDFASVERALIESQARIVFHVAGLVKAQRWGTGKDSFTRVNAEGVEIVAAACARQRDRPVLVVVSSLAAAGPNDQLRLESDGPVPVSSYGRSKLAGELAAARYAEVVPITIVRPPIVFGPGDRGVFEMFRPIAGWGLHIVPGRGKRRYSLIHVDDLVEGLLLAAEKGERLRADASPGHGIYFMAGEQHPTYAQLGRAIAVALGQKAPIVMPLPRPFVRLIGIGEDVMARVSCKPRWVSSDKITEALAGSWACSSAKARTQLGWSPAATLADRLRETAEWYRQAGWL